MDLRRIATHLLTSDRLVRRAFPQGALDAIERAITASEATHAGQIRFVIEGALDGLPLLRGQTARARAVELFSQLGVWDTAHNNGVLVYVLLADHAVEIVVDRGLQAKVGDTAWADICQAMQTAFAGRAFESGATGGVRAATRQLALHFPADSPRPNELPDTPLLL